MISNPLELKSHLTTVAGRRFDAVPFLDVCLIGLFFALNSSIFIYGGVGIELPKLGSGTMQGVPTSAVLTVRQEDVLLLGEEVLRLDRLPGVLGAEDAGAGVGPAAISVRPEYTLLFRGEILGFETLGDAFGRYVEEQSGVAPVLLVKASKRLSVEKLMEICDLAKVAGFSRVQLAAEEKAGDGRSLVVDEVPPDGGGGGF